MTLIHSAWREVLQVELQVAQVEAELGKALASLERAVGCEINEHPPAPGPPPRPGRDAGPGPGPAGLGDPRPFPGILNGARVEESVRCRDRTPGCGAVFPRRGAPPVARISNAARNATRSQRETSAAKTAALVFPSGARTSGLPGRPRNRAESSRSHSRPRAIRREAGRARSGGNSLCSEAAPSGMVRHGPTVYLLPSSPLAPGWLTQYQDWQSSNFLEDQDLPHRPGFVWWSCADSFSRNSSGVSLRNSQKLRSGSFRPSRPYGV